MDRFAYETEQSQQWVWFDQEQPAHYRDVLVCIGCNGRFAEIVKIARYISQHSIEKDDACYVDTDKYQTHEGKDYLPAGFIYYKKDSPLNYAPYHYLDEPVIAWQPLPMVPAFARQHMEKLAASAT